LDDNSTLLAEEWRSCWPPLWIHSTNLLRLRGDMMSPNEAAHHPQIERISDRKRYKDKDPMPRLKARLIEAYWEVRGLDEQGNLHGSQSRRNGATPRWSARRNYDLSASPTSKPQEEPQCNGTKNDRQHELAENSDNGSTRSRQRNTSDIGRNQEAIRNTTLEC